MKKLSLLEYTENFKKIEQKLLESMDEETGEIDESLLKDLNEKQIDFEEKCRNIAIFIKNLDANIEGLKSMIHKVQTRKKVMERLKEYLLKNLSNSMQSVGVKKIDGDVPISLRKSPPKLVIEEEEKIHKAYFIKVEKLDTKSLKSALMAGAKIPGASLEQNVYIKFF